MTKKLIYGKRKTQPINSANKLSHHLLLFPTAAARWPACAVPASWPQEAEREVRWTKLPSSRPPAPWPTAWTRLARGRSPPSARRAATRRGDCARSSTTWGPASSRPSPARRPPSAAPVSLRPSLLSYFVTGHFARRRAPPGH